MIFFCFFECIFGLQKSYIPGVLQLKLRPKNAQDFFKFMKLFKGREEGKRKVVARLLYWIVTAM
jgi:hypothetical protein